MSSRVGTYIIFPRKKLICRIENDNDLGILVETRFNASENKIIFV